MKWGRSRAQPWPARASIKRKCGRVRPLSPRPVKNPVPAVRKNLKRGAPIRIWGSPNSHVPVAACRSVGIRTRGRTAARDGKRMEGDGHPLKSRSRFSQEGRSRTATGSRRQNRRTPNLHGGRSLKQRRSGLFWSRRLSTGRHRRGLSFIAGRAGSPQSTVFRVRTFRPLSLGVSIAPRIANVSPRLHVVSAPLAPKRSRADDRAHP